jgi:signal transduction histidine kinase
MTAQVQSGAIVEERARLAREMHDGLSQILGFLNLEMQSLELLVSQNKMDATLKELGRARQRIRDAQAEVRENILNLRTALSKDGEAIPFLCEYIAEFATQTGIEAHVETPDGEKISLTPMCEVQLVRIIQEALTNVRLHAHANHIWIKFEPQAGQLCVEIRDDGIGFVEKTLKKHFGLQSMRERTESVQGKLSIESKLGHGTQLRLCLPLSQQHPEVPSVQTVAA